MKKYTLFFFIVFSLSCNREEAAVLDLSPLTDTDESTQSEEDDSVTGVFLKAVDQLFSEGNFGQSSREHMKVEVDEANYFAKITSFEWDGLVEATIFIKPDGAYVLALSSLGCGPICRQTLEFYEPIDGKWVKNESIFPGLTEEEEKSLKEQEIALVEDYAPLYILPQEGVDIVLVNQYSFAEKTPLYVFPWKGGKFLKVKQ